MRMLLKSLRVGTLKISDESRILAHVEYVNKITLKIYVNTSVSARVISGNVENAPVSKDKTK
jgi:hypothetical protein